MRVLLAPFLALAVLFALHDEALAQAQVRPCFDVPGQLNCQDVSAVTPLPVTTAGGSSSTLLDCGGSITAGGTAQLAISATQNKNGFLLEVGVNDSNTDPIYFSATSITPGAGVAGSFSLNPSSTTAAGGSFTSPVSYPKGVNVYVNGATTGDKFKCNVW